MVPFTTEVSFFLEFALNHSSHEQIYVCVLVGFTGTIKIAKGYNEWARFFLVRVWVLLATL